ncbi:P-loop containing nucleoside triphosphate hydrolase [Pseudocohnilembus persalinus]|uniref:Kinesin-like protein n=1 Tax=Pseudocohnilembus persalinus TaxID=266149 RepID=A0A0V0R345_PSEPJ|nr:P-loop containing nucleoside triphosphate hydrolase [Pseudocohnilembus persalinus]|eukprot:KRX08845.1 P-loop containing nucleoside triphosphate hydrolase [Pseudocohnilembus persalinus]
MFKADPSDNIKVVVRIRPVNQRETDENGAECIFDLENQNELEQFQEQENEQDQQQFQEQEKQEIQEKQLDQDIIQQNENIYLKQKNIQKYQKSFYFGTQDDHKQYSFDYVAKQNSTQDEIYQIIGVPLSEFALDGYNICIFAYGQTGTGKTHTMYGKIGDTEQEGLQTRILKKIFQEINKNQQPGKQTLCYCNYFEIYNENIIDLLSEDIDKGVQVQIREDVKKGVFVENLQNKYITSYEEGMEILNEGNQSRHVAATKMNLESSRSHSIFQFHIQQKISKNGITNFKDSKINFVDLAGSERQKQTHATGERLKEATNINRSLSILGRVINSLVEKQKKKNIHIPYRDSKLTFILKGWSKKGVQFFSSVPEKSINYSVISVISRFVVEGYFIVKGGVLYEYFGAFLNLLHEKLIKKYQQDKIIYVLDNAASHRAKNLNFLIYNKINHIKTPPYCPELNPIELMFSQIKNLLKQFEIQYQGNLLLSIVRSFELVKEDSLGGNAKTVMIATITASDLAYQETLSTIKFAQRAKQITNQAQKNEETSGSLALLQKEIKILKRQIDDYKQKMMLYESGNFQIGSQHQKQQHESELVENSEISDVKIQNLNQYNDQNMQNERLDTEEKENLNSMQFSQNLDQKLVDEMKMLKDQLAVKEHELNINEIKYQELEFDLNHQKERNKILEKQNKELQDQLDEQQDELNNQIQELEEENESNKEIIEQFQQTREKEESTNENLSLQPKSTIKSKAQSMLKSRLEGAVQKSAMIGADQETEKLRAENQFLNEKLEKFYMLQDKFLNQSSMKEQQQMINNSKLRVKEEDKVLDLISVNDNLLKQIQQFQEENEELKNEINKLNEDNDTLKETVFYISTQLNQKRKQEKLLAQSIQMQHQNQSSLDFTPRSREVSELANSQNFRKQQSIQQSIKDFSKKQEEMHNFDFFQYYSDFKYQILLENLDDVENFLKDSYAQVHQDFTSFRLKLFQRNCQQLKKIREFERNKNYN